jgi:hypothetical protein
MNRTNCAEWMESLEDRRLFAASPLALMLHSVPTTPSLVGTYTGTVHDSNEKAAGTITTIIKTDSNGKITGVTESKYPHEHTHDNDFTGKVSGNTLTITTSTTTIKIKLSDNDRVLTGSYVFKNGDDSSTGKFVVTRSK